MPSESNVYNPQLTGLSSNWSSTLHCDSAFPCIEPQLDSALNTLQQQLQRFAASENATEQLDFIYAISNPEAVQTQLSNWANQVFTDLPTISILDDSTLKGALGAYSAERDTIYLAQSLLNPESQAQLQAVLSEEYGHHLDRQFNSNGDTSGDEGELFSLILRGVDLKNTNLAHILSEDDSSLIYLDGHSISIEQYTTDCDFNRDCNPDILWRDPVSGTNVVWFMGGTNNNQMTGYTVLTNIGGSWDVKGIADFNQDGNPDLVWRDPVSGTNVVWFMGGTNNDQITGYTVLTNVGGSWDIKGIADFNQDGRPDLVWRDSASGANVVWFMGGTNNSQMIGYTTLSAVGGSWDIKGIADFNQDGRPDLVWRDSASGANVIWFMGGTNNSQMIGYTTLSAVGGSWDIKGVADHNKDSRPDLIWRDPVSGTNVVWFMGDTNNSQMIGYTVLTNVGGSWNPIVKGWQAEADLVIQSQSVPSSAIAGETISINSYTKNSGFATAGSSYVRYWLSDDAVLNKGVDRYLGENSVGSLSIGTSEYDSFSFTYNASWGTGTKYIFFEADNYNNVAESNEFNNTAYQAITINAPQPDLVIQSLTVPTSATTGSSISLSAYTKNNGAAIAGSSYVRYWLSDDAVLNTNSDRYLGENFVNSLSAGASEYDSFSFTYNASWGTGTKYIFFEADGYSWVTESNESNNTAYQAIAIISPYITVTSPNGSNSLNLGSSYSITWNDNISENVKIDLYRGSIYHSTIATSIASNGSYSWTVPTTLAGGNDYKLRISSVNNSSLYDDSDSFFMLDGAGNSTGTARYIPISSTVIAYTDWVDSSDTNDYYSFTLSNTSTFNLALAELSQDADVYLLDSNGSWITSSTNIGTTSESITKQLNAGTYYIRVFPYSTNSAKYTLIVSATTLSQSDLVIQNQFVPSSATTGSLISISSYTKNNGTATAGSSTVRYWLSDDAVLNTSSDRLLGSNSVNSLSAGTSEYDSFSFTYDSSWGTGTKYIFFEADGYGNVAESNESNNTVYQAITINAAATTIDLKGSTFSLSSTSLSAGNSVTAYFGVQNIGTGNASSFNVKFYLSTDSTINSSDKYLTSYTVSSLGGGLSTGTLSTSLVLPGATDAFWSGSKTYYIGMIVDADNSISESNESNNANTGSGLDYKDAYVTIPANSFNITFDYRFDTNGWFTTARRNALEAAATIWEAIILDEFADKPVGTNTPYVWDPQTGDYVGTNNIFTTDVVIDDLLIFVGARNFTDSTLGVGGSSGNYAGESRYVGDDFEPWIGSISFNSNANWFFDADIPLISDTIPWGQSDFVSVAIHEIAHILGISSGVNAFDRYVQSLNGNYYFTGANATAQNGGYSLPLDPGQSHIQENYEYGTSGEVAMDPTITSGTRKLVTRLDAALLDDIGYAIDYSKTYQNP